MSEASPDRLESWKEIAAHLRRSVRTVRRWEAQEGLPVHRHMHRSQASVYAFKSEIDSWLQKRAAAPAARPAPTRAADTTAIEGGAASVAVLPFDNLTGDWDNITPKLGAQWNFSDSGQIYGFWSKGYRSGGFNFRNARPFIIPPGPTREEENNTYEVGLKTDFADGRVRLNVAAFYNEITDMQRELNIGDPDVIVLQATINAGDVTIQGAEVDLVAAPQPDLAVAPEGDQQTVGRDVGGGHQTDVGQGGDQLHRQVVARLRDVA